MAKGKRKQKKPAKVQEAAPEIVIVHSMGGAIDVYSDNESIGVEIINADTAEGAEIREAIAGLTQIY